MVRKPRKTAKQKADACRPKLTLRRLREYDMDAAARVAYESFIRQLGMKIGQRVSDVSGVHRIPSWDQHKSFVKARWRAIAQAVIDAATKKLA